MKQYHEINFVRSVLILLVILVHIVYFGELYPAVKAGILGFMMPSFLVVTGYLVNIEKTFKEFSLYLFRIFVPYLIMVVGFSVLSAFLPVRDGIAEITVSVLLEKVFVSSIGPYWFLYVMMGCGICYYLSFKILPIGKHVAVRLIAFAGLLYLASLVVPLMTVKIVMYYFVGAALRQLKLEYSSVFSPTVLGGFCLFALLFLTNDRDWGSILVVLTVIEFLAFSNLGSSFSLSPSQRLCRLDRHEHAAHLSLSSHIYDGWEVLSPLLCMGFNRNLLHHSHPLACCLRFAPYCMAVGQDQLV